VNQNDKRRIQDILELAAELAEYVNEGQGRFDSEMSQVRAVERVIELIGESASAISSHTRATIVDFGHR
jgi:uncharacterized protein with HEPN domain